MILTVPQMLASQSLRNIFFSTVPTPLTSERTSGLSVWANLEAGSCPVDQFGNLIGHYSYWPINSKSVCSCQINKSVYGLS